MDSHANYLQNLTTEIDWLHYFDLVDQLPFGYDTLESYHRNQVPLTKQDQNYVSELGFPEVETAIRSNNTSDCDAVNNHIGHNNKKRSRPLELAEIEKYFEMPIAMAAKEFNVGLTMFKKRCRELGIKKWPYRKLKSLKSLIHNAKEFGFEEEIEKLEEQKKMIKKVPEMKLDRRTTKVRQVFFKATYKKRRQVPLATL